ncbi:bifunctional diaminohydroxyphosphoribosylaminopyrimidine deaminase/5-amino-6-(5-phosphoribosylamino)uracil reductase RibD [Marinirhabdus gelatinilytica]|uniref:Riboflavin biosynthesis protein RibD n=1 Tax=Marinirhabdus gelatinilytica TaxID=1703343 RepID=A0A370QER0_9FLAO|nr:bifunctional diaminohydroxyphosphoribosylaminopyrimidine deaminase/5-amino-6-(5-phosphoribosylamino)uracil reductase RibD [Marinirhabdus gelatinilytica]RDK86854.1 diaminohydroxyphosphoribosylaminopyrimidine deaminase [Marinirhabdus gelatinilytica]
MKIHEKYMRRCIQLAKNGLGTTYPNPLVGSVVVHNDLIIGEGWHHQAGQPHAEVNAIDAVRDSSLLKDATIYVSLEPCSHFGKTPPCAGLIVSKDIKKVVVGTIDPNPKVAGQGIKKLMEAGCDVMVGVLEDECNELNKRFFNFQQQKRPYIFLKWAQTANGFIAPESRDEQKPVWITNEFSRQVSHKLRAEEQAILVGTTTVLDDNPSLTTRDWFGEHPTRIILDRKLRIDLRASVYNSKANTIFITETQQKTEGNIIFETIDFSGNIAMQICTIAHKHSLQSLIVEGGSQTLQTFIDTNFWDEAYVFKGASFFEKGTKAPKFSGTLVRQTQIVQDVLQHYKNPSA